MSTPFELFPGFKTPPTDPKRDLRPPVTVALSPEELDDNDCDQQEPYCDFCANTGSLDCWCGGDLCVCDNNGEYPCPECV
jgi:hypothetical protein